jgi:ABC-type Fe3+-siderophore transport system permease subunit
MDGIQFFTLSLGGALFFMGWLLTAGNWANWKKPGKGFKSKEEAALIQGRWGRRVHMSLALMGLGAAIALGAFLGREKITALYWYGVVALALWMSVLAIVDGGATWSYVCRVRRELAKKRKAIVNEVAARSPRLLNQMEQTEPNSDTDGAQQNRLEHH